jgi:glyoxylase-like metal-dependent hydrolase (beta-lactamase superfamily II)
VRPGTLSPLQLPLPGGREGTTVRLHPLLTGELFAPPGLLARAGGPLSQLHAVAAPRSRRIWIRAPAFLVEHPTAGAILVDTGLHPDAVSDPRRTMGHVMTLLYDFRAEPEQALGRQLSERGVQPDALRAIVMTHLHADHASGLPALPRLPIVVDSGEWGPATARNAFANGYSARHLDPSYDWRAVDYSAAAPHGPFPRALDLFGDGSVRLAATPGHTAGHQSVILRLPEREALLTGDAAYTLRTIADGVMPGLVHDEDDFRASLASIQRFVQESPDVLVVPGHDPDAWARLERSYG